MTLSIVLPAFSEEENISFIYNEIVSLDIGNVKLKELIFVDDGSLDKTFERVKELAGKDQRVKGIRFSRNFGKQIALLAGLNESTGEITITMDTDGQHPPALIPDLIAEYEKGFDIVNTNRTITEDEGWFKRVTSRGFYRILNRLSDQRD